MTAPDDASSIAEPAKDPAAARKRPAPGQRRQQILETLAHMLQQPGAERITTAALAAQLQVSEAALYRHFASKAQMFEGLIDFIEQSILGLINQIAEREPDPAAQAQRILATLLQFAEKNPGMARVMVGDALVLENERLQQRINLLFDKIESHLRQCLRQHAESQASATPTVDAQVRSAVMVAFAIGRMHRHVRSGFKRQPTEQLDACLRQLLA
ncbi:MAG: nucleoid occlusion factor SlmA [Brachymonas sp.]|nr:nucleoid occlusion factor SlmA [Brachymonas sp.]